VVEVLHAPHPKALSLLLGLGEHLCEGGGRSWSDQGGQKTEGDVSNPAAQNPGPRPRQPCATSNRWATVAWFTSGATTARARGAHRAAGPTRSVKRFHISVPLQSQCLGHTRGARRGRPTEFAHAPPRQHAATVLITRAGLTGARGVREHGWSALPIKIEESLSRRGVLLSHFFQSTSSQLSKVNF